MLRTVRFFLMKLIFLFNKDRCIKLIKSDSQGFYTVKKKSTSYKCCSFNFVHQIILHKMYHGFHKNMKLFSTLIIIRNVS